MTKQQLADFIPHLLDLARKAGDAIIPIYNGAQPVEITTKENNTPLTTADMVSHDTIVAGLKELTPDIPILSEEQSTIDFAIRSQWKSYWLVDPLDGTREFIRHNGEFVINIALIEDHKPVLGLIYLPVDRDCYYAYSGSGAMVIDEEGVEFPLRVKQWDPEDATVVVSRNPEMQKLSAWDVVSWEPNFVTIGSALKYCQIARGAADIYPQMGITCEWDSAAGQCIVEEAGGKIIDLAGNELRYNTKDSLVNPHFLALGDASAILADIPLKQLREGD